MKYIQLICFLLSSLLIASSTLTAATTQAGPHGGRVLAGEDPVEFSVNADGKAVITFLDEALQPEAPSGRFARVFVMTDGGRHPLELSVGDNALVSAEPLPEGEGYTIVVQVYADPEARPRNFRIVYETHVCSGCDLQEYACICGH